MAQTDAVILRLKTENKKYVLIYHFRTIILVFDWLNQKPLYVGGWSNTDRDILNLFFNKNYLPYIATRKGGFLHIEDEDGNTVETLPLSELEDKINVEAYAFRYYIKERNILFF